MRLVDLRSAIETPAKKAGLSFAPLELVDQILSEVGTQEGRLPLLPLPTGQDRPHRRQDAAAHADGLQARRAQGICAMAKPPSVEEEDRRRLGRERKTLIAERVEYVNRIKGLLFTQGPSTTNRCAATGERDSRGCARARAMLCLLG